MYLLSKIIDNIIEKIIANYLTQIIMNTNKYTQSSYKSNHNNTTLILDLNEIISVNMHTN